ncbi:MAG: LysM peptidoglycan-binding domain-containing protein [Anaerolineales bacterium]|nr:LysM peptidoglycan-binding domain-containing protein [Anaerolineales bacterium]
MVVFLQTRSNAKLRKRQSRVGLLLAGLVLMLASLACYLEAPTAADPIFIAPQGVSRRTVVTEIEQPINEAQHPEEAAAANLPFQPEQTPVLPSNIIPTPSPIQTPTEIIDDSPIMYFSQTGDTLPAIAARFNVGADEITSLDLDIIPESTWLEPNQRLIIPRRVGNTTPSTHIFPDSEVVFSPSAVGFDIHEFTQQAGGYLSTYREYLGSTGMTSGADVVYRVAIENSINPRLLLALLEYQSGWVYGQPEIQSQIDYAMGIPIPRYAGLYHQLSLSVNQLSMGYYGWREGRITEITFRDGISSRLAPELNAGSVALQFYFAQRRESLGWYETLEPSGSFLTLYNDMFGDPWERAQVVEPLFSHALEQPPLILPFMLNQRWALTGGPHGAWDRDGAMAAIDFAPGSVEPGCVKSDAFAVAAAAGLIVRSENAVVAIDLDGDGHEQTGWVLMYLHIAQDGRIPAGTWVDVGDPIGHPSCEGGRSTGTHIHIARKYNGEWVPADGPLPFILSGWRVHAGENPYEGIMTRDDEEVVASQLSVGASHIFRRSTDP